MTTIPKPRHCGENWLEMTSTNGGRICRQCDKTIVDFSKMKWTEIERIQNLNNNAVCGMYNPKQLDDWGREVKMPTNHIKQIIAITSLTAFLTTTAYSQLNNSDSLIITGRVIDTNTKDPLPFASIKLIKNKVGCSTNIDGNFKLLVKNISETTASDTLEIIYVGYISRKIIFNDLKEIAKQETNIGLDSINLDLTMTPEIVYSTTFYVRKPTFREKVKFRFKTWFGRKK